MSAGNLLIQCRRIPSDQLTPVLAYRRLVAPDDRNAPSFLLESVEQSGGIGRYSMLGARPAQEVIARENAVEVLRNGTLEKRLEAADPLQIPRQITADWKPFSRGAIPAAFHGGWVGFLSFDAVRWLEPKALSFKNAPRDDRHLPDMHMGLYLQVVVFDHATRTLDCVVARPLGEHGSEAAARTAADEAIENLKLELLRERPALPTGEIHIDLRVPPKPPARSSMSRAEFEGAVAKAKQAIVAGDAFQIVLSQRLERETAIDPFEIYRALRIVNPSPYQVYLQASGCILAASSPEILCRVRDRTVVSRPLAGTRPRGDTPELDTKLEAELRADEKERAEHIMLVDLGRNDLGRVCESGSVQVERCMDVERYSHVMHLSSTVTGELGMGLDAWDALRATLPVGTVSGAPKIRAIQIIDQLEPVRRGPYAGGIGVIGFDGSMDMAISLRTMVMPTNRKPGAPWTVHLQAGAGVVLDSDPATEWQETMSKAAGLGRAMDLAEDAFSGS
ncbi:MAG: anthranilate synthase component I [Planctomycetes bacterium]|nr:anthranilate synthase component I [Planctomycetota bacterium]